MKPTVYSPTSYAGANWGFFDDVHDEEMWSFWSAKYFVDMVVIYSLYTRIVWTHH